MRNPTIRRVAAIGVAAVAVSLLILLVRSRGSSGEQPSQRVETVATGPAGQPGPIDVIKPAFPDDPGQPKIDGPFRLLPFGFIDKTPNATATPGVCEPASTSLNDQREIERSPLYALVSYVPDTFTLVEVRPTQACGSQIVELGWRYQGIKASSIEISRAYAAPPIDVRVPPDDSWYTLASSTIAGHPAIVGASKPGHGGPQSVYVYDGTVLTVIQGDVARIDDLLKLAESFK